MSPPAAVDGPAFAAMAAGIPFLQEMVVLFTVSALLAYVCYRLRLVPIVGFLVVLERLRLVQTPILDLAGMRDFETAVSDAQYLDRAIDRLEKRLANLREELALHQQDRTNRRLAVLTVLSAVFLPLTLIAGIYGMNFEVMPELGYRFAYPLAIGSMVVLGLGMIAWFRSRGWFD